MNQNHTGFDRVRISFLVLFDFDVSKTNTLIFVIFLGLKYDGKHLLVKCHEKECKKQ